ncbi:hypothetical protein BD410DRAFT_811560 [Rickenella mellea]|uniref:DUF803-domain-containing protein n=1 Tax=Rickenella mellea TaxID=50990 RepID=A0A4Y7QNF9_9AGAM|nr:hypothetical protein BD410DRAFT_811560 [Rickenella mellea]
MTSDVDNPHISVAVGITVGLLASFVQSLGLTIQRKSHVQNQLLPEADQRVEHRRPLWLIGFAIFISSNILGSLFQIASLPVVILAPLGAVSLLWNAFFARLILGDVFSPWMVLGTLLIAGGAVLIAVFGIVPEPTHSLEDLLELFARPAFVAYFSLLGAALLAALIITHVVEYSLSRKLISPPLTPPMSPRPLSQSLPTLATPQPSVLSGTTERTPLINRKVDPSRASTPTLPHLSPAIIRTRLVLSLSYSSASGILSGMCLIFAKSGVELLLLTVGGKNQFWRWESWVLVLSLVIFALLQLWYLHKGLIFADPTIVCPLAFCFYNLSSIVNGLVYFDQFGLLTTLHLALVSLGIVILLGGVWLVTFQAGGGGVDVGTWQEEDEVDSESFTDLTVSEQRPTHSRIITSPAQLETPEPVSTPFPTTSTGDTSALDDETDATPPTSPLSQRMRRRRSRFTSFLQPTDSHAAVGGSSTLNLPGGGFSIGLSPVSPGFALLPQRRVSGLRSVVRRAAMRRTVSESDINGVSEEAGEASLSAERERLRKAKAKARWKWLGQVFGLKD